MEAPGLSRTGGSGKDHAEDLIGSSLWTEAASVQPPGGLVLHVNCASRPDSRVSAASQQVRALQQHTVRD